jgi:glycosyltransferase involved in cell wall biosynthesis
MTDHRVAMTGEYRLVMDISVIICTYNRGEYLRKVLVDLTRQDAVSHASFEVIIVDNNSTDTTKVICAEFVALYPEIFRYIHEEKQGKTFALNTGVRASKGNIIAFTDDDVVVDGRWLFSVKQAFAANPECKAFGGRVIPVWPDTVPPWIGREGTFKNTWGAIVEHDFGDMVTSYFQDEQNYPCGANMFFSKEIFKLNGNFNECLNHGVQNIPMLEDIEFCKRLLENHENILYIPDAVVYHPVVPERLTKKYFIKHAFKSGRAQYFIRNLQRRGHYVMLDLRKNRRRLLNVPIYFIRETVGILKKYLVTVCGRNFKGAQYYENMLVYYLGIMYECFTQRKNKSSII